ncbi:MAG: hypothetical protein AB1640_20230 [bacterium]
MKLRTASEALRFIAELEETAAAFYEELARRLPAQADPFLGWAKENRRFVREVQRTYQSAITDALEGCFAFDLDTDRFVVNAELPPGAAEAEAAAAALSLERQLLGLYGAATEQAGALLADLPRTFRMIAKKRQGRLERLALLK